jgi:hypothetical protein
MKLPSLTTLLYTSEDALHLLSLASTSALFAILIPKHV